MEEKGFKKLLIDLEMTQTEIARAVGISRWAVTLYFRGKLKAARTRRDIKWLLRRRAHEMDIPLPQFWEDAAA